MCIYRTTSYLGLWRIITIMHALQFPLKPGFNGGIILVNILKSSVNQAILVNQRPLTRFTYLELLLHMLSNTIQMSSRTATYSKHRVVIFIEKIVPKRANNRHSSVLLSPASCMQYVLLYIIHEKQRIHTTLIFQFNGYWHKVTT